MTNTSHKYHKKTLLKWLLTVTLLFSVFSFSENANNFQLNNLQNPQIELVLSYNNESNKKTVSYSKLFNVIVCAKSTTCIFCNWISTILNYNQQLKIKFQYLLEQFNSYKSTNHFLNVKIISQNSDEDIFATFVG